ncbi:MAG: hypothetical protein ABIF09_16960 [Gemmatimonadota bacterium]
MKRTVISFLLVVSGLPSAGPTHLASQQPSLFQELGVFAISAQSNHSELPDPRGFGASASWEFAGWLMARLSYQRVSNDTRKVGVVCDQYSQRINCRPEMTETSAALSGLRGALTGALPLGERVRLGVGGGMSFNHLTARSVGVESGLDADLLAPNAGIIGLSALITAALSPFATIPVRLTGGFGVHWVNFNTCSGNDPPQYDPFCGMEPIKEIELGLSYAF